MKVDGPLVVHGGKGEYATSTGVGSGIEGPVIPVLELIEEMILNQVT